MQPGPFSVGLRPITVDGLEYFATNYRAEFLSGGAGDFFDFLISTDGLQLIDPATPNAAEIRARAERCDPMSATCSEAGCSTCACSCSLPPSATLITTHCLAVCDGVRRSTQRRATAVCSR